MLKQLYEYVLRLASHPRAELALFIVAFIESSIFPIPPDVLLIPMVIVAFNKAFRYAFICTAGSVLGGLFGYGIGYLFYDTLGQQIIGFYGLESRFDEFKAVYDGFSVYIVGVAAISPIPYKVFTIFSGLMHTGLGEFLFASILGRGARFFLIAWLLWRGGPAFKGWIERNLYPLTMAAGVILILVIVLIKFMFKAA